MIDKKKEFSKQKKIIIIIMSVIFVGFLSLLIYKVTTKEVYYLNSDSLAITHGRIRVKNVGSESTLQSFLRKYLTGMPDYKVKIPFTYDTMLLSSSLDEEKNTLVLNWNSYFYKALEKNTAEEEIKLLLFSIKKNFSIEKVYFLVEGSPVYISFTDIDLSQEIDIQNIEIEKNIKK